MIYGGGMLELGQTFSLEQQVIDNDIIMMERKFMEGIPVTDETLAVDAIKFIGIGNDFIAHPSTMEQIDLASDPEIFDRTMLGEWRANGKKDAVDRAHDKVVDILANHIVTPVPDDVMAAWEPRVHEAVEVFLTKKECT